MRPTSHSLLQQLCAAFLNPCVIPLGDFRALKPTIQTQQPITQTAALAFRGTRSVLIVLICIGAVAERAVHRLRQQRQIAKRVQQAFTPGARLLHFIGRQLARRISFHRDRRVRRQRVITRAFPVLRQYVLDTQGGS